jgi:hypothetical protein
MVKLMRRYFESLLLVGLFVLTASPVFAERPKPDEEIAPAPVAVQRVAVHGYALRDEAAMVLIGTALIALAAAVRRAA